MRRSVFLVVLLLLSLACETQQSRNAPSTASSPAPPTKAQATTAQTPAKPREAGGVGYLVRHAGGAKATDTLPMVVAIHGLGDRPSSFGLLSAYPAKARIIVPRGLARHGRGFSWFPISVRGNRDPRKVAAAMHEAVERLGAMLAVLTTRYPTRGKPIVTGFSQGGMLSFALAVKHPEKIALALPVSGWLPAPLVPSAAAANTPPIIAFHGDADPILPIAPTRKSVASLRDAGYKIELLEFHGIGHTVSAEMRRELYGRIARAQR